MTDETDPTPDPVTVYAEELYERARWAILYNDREPDPRLPEAERLAVLSVIDDEKLSTAASEQAIAHVASRIGGTRYAAGVLIARVRARPLHDELSEGQADVPPMVTVPADVDVHIGYDPKVARDITPKECARH